MSQKRIIKIKWQNFFLFIILNTFIVIIILASIKEIKWYLDAKETATQINNIIETAKIKEIEDNEITEIIEIPPPEPLNPYWDYLKMNLIDVDFQNLKQENNSTIGWLQVSGTNINYPFVQAADNNYYLNHSFNKSINSAGWVFMDYRNSKATLDKNTIIYGHGRNDKTMFGTLKNTLTKEWLANPNNYIIKMSTEHENTLWQIFSTYHIETTSDYLKTEFNSSTEFNDFVNTITARSTFNFNTSLTANDKILTLSTCYNDEEKMVLHAKLIKIQKK